MDKVENVPESLLTEAGTVLGYVFCILPTGYVVVTSDTELIPVIAYSFECDFSWEESPDNALLQILRSDLANRLSCLRSGEMDDRAIEANKQAWLAMAAADVSPSVERDGSTIYGPWLMSYWGQGASYNARCPVDPVTGSRCVTGCVATALAQVLNYWQYPASIAFVTGDSYTSQLDPGDGGGQRTIAINATTANSSSVDYGFGLPVDETVSELCYAAGVAVRMNYTSWGSSADEEVIPAALAGRWIPPSFAAPPNRLGYQSAELRSYDASHSGWGVPYYCSQSAFYTQLSGDMQAARPALLSLNPTSGAAHCIVVDGWKGGTSEYHLNYGWEGSAAGWYSLPSGLPSPFTIVDFAILNICPSTTTHTLTVTTSGGGSVTRVPDLATYQEGSHVILTANPASGWYFHHWEGDLTGWMRATRISLDRGRSAVAVFSQLPPAVGAVIGENHASCGGRGDHDVMAVCTDGTVHFCYPAFDYPNPGDVSLVYAKGMGTHWSYETVATARCLDGTVAIDAEGVVHLLYWDGQSNEIRHAVREEAGWGLETVLSGVEYPMAIDSAFDPLGRLHIACAEEMRLGMPLRYAYRDAAGWHEGSLASSAWGESVSLAVDADNHPHLAYSQEWHPYPGVSVVVMRHAWQDGGGWFEESIGQGQGEPGRRPSITFDEQGVLHIAFSRSGGLRYGMKTPSGWVFQWLIPGSGSWDGYCSLSMGAGGGPLIAFEGSTSELTLAWVDGDGWRVECLAQLAGGARDAVTARERVPGEFHVGYTDGFSIAYMQIGGGVATPAAFRIAAGGEIFSDDAISGHIFLSGAADVAEWVSVTDPVEAGDVLELDTACPGSYHPTQIACSLLVAGVVSTQPGVALGATTVTGERALLALSGIVPVKVTNEGGPIQPGDLLVSSSTPGYAMRWAGPESCPCALVGKALEPMTGERGVILVLLTSH